MPRAAKASHAQTFAMKDVDKGKRWQVRKRSRQNHSSKQQDRLRFRSVENWDKRIITICLAVLAPVAGVGYIVWLGFNAGQRLAEGPVDGQAQWQVTLLMVSLIIILCTETLRLSLVYMMSLSTSLARQPLPESVPDKLRAALFITFVPASEDIDVLERSLIGAKHIEFPKGRFTIFVLDEGYANLYEKLNSGEQITAAEHKRYYAVAQLIGRLNRKYSGHKIYRISRCGRKGYNHHRGRFAQRTKHGNINAALEEISRHPKRYGRFDVVMGLDPDHCPKPDFAYGMLGWFSHPNIAYVAGPQAYRNAQFNWVARLAESQQFVFHSCIQPAANTYGAPMLVGTSYAVRWRALESIGGMQSSITEDMATTYKLLSSTNNSSGKTWQGLYTREVLAEGEGPSSWGDFYKQQDRWSRGAMEYLFDGSFARALLQMVRKHPMRALHYLFLMSFYPVTAVAWLLTSFNALLYGIAGSDMQIVDPGLWLLMYGWVAIIQIAMYVWARRGNVSPFEFSSSWGFYGMFMSIISAPVYTAVLFKTLLCRPVGFTVTPKGSHATGDSWYVFRLNIVWSAFYAALIVLVVAQNHIAFSTLMWPVLGLLLSLSPILLWRVSMLRQSYHDEIISRLARVTQPHARKEGVRKTISLYQYYMRAITAGLMVAPLNTISRETVAFIDYKTTKRPLISHSVIMKRAHVLLGDANYASTDPKHLAKSDDLGLLPESGGASI